jgi:hypothetical protein
MQKQKPSRFPVAVNALLVWMAINAVFFALEVTLFNDAQDANNSILLILWITSMATLLLTKKTGYAVSIFTLIYAFCFNAFNIIYFSADLPFAALLINIASAAINAVAFIYLFKTLLKTAES